MRLLNLRHRNDPGPERLQTQGANPRVRANASILPTVFAKDVGESSMPRTVIDREMRASLAEVNIVAASRRFAEMEDVEHKKQNGKPTLIDGCASVAPERGVNCGNMNSSSRRLGISKRLENIDSPNIPANFQRVCRYSKWKVDQRYSGRPQHFEDRTGWWQALMAGGEESRALLPQSTYRESAANGKLG